MRNSYKSAWRLVCTAMLAVVLGVGSASAQWTQGKTLIGAPGIGDGLVGAYVGSIGNWLYAWGGVTGNIITYNGRGLNTASVNGWTKVADMPLDGGSTAPVAKLNGFAATAAGNLYIMGGYTVVNNNYVFFNTLFQYTQSSNSFETKTALPVPLTEMTGAVVNDRIYVIGGFTMSGSNILASPNTYSYNPATEAWQTVSGSMPTTTFNSTAQAIGNDIYVFGGIPTSGQTPINAVYKGTVSGDGSSISWSAVTPMPKALERCASGVLDGKIYIAGGNDENGPSRSVYVYDPAADTWTASYPLPVATYGVMSMPVVDSKMYYIGGAGSPMTYVFEAGEPKAVASVDRTLVPMIVEKGAATSTSATVNFGNEGIIPLESSVTVPGDASWLSADTSFTVTPGSSHALTLQADASALDVGTYKTMVTVATNDPDHPTVMLDVRLYVVDNLVKQPQNAVVEEATGTWCVWCPYGYDILDQLEGQYGDRLIDISYHLQNGNQIADPMQFSEGLQMLSRFGASSYPSASIQRTVMPEEKEVMTNRGVWQTYITRVLNTPYAPVAVTVKSYSFDPATRQIKAQLQFDVASAIPGNQIMLTTAITQDNITADQAWTDGSTSKLLTGYVHAHAGRALLPSSAGAAVTVPAEDLDDGSVIRPGASFVANVTLTIPQPEAGRAPYVFDDMHTIFIAHGTAANYLGPVYQGVSIPLTSSIDAGAPIAVTTDATQKMIAVEETATFTSTVTNRTDAPLDVTVTRTTNDMPASWTSRMCIGDQPCLDPSTDVSTFTIPAGDSMAVNVEILGGTADATGNVTLQFTTGSTSIDKSFSATTAAISSVDNSAVTGSTLAINGVFPNPVSTSASVNYSVAKAGAVTLEVYAVDGTRVLRFDDGHQAVGSHTSTLDVSKLPAGTYTVVVSSNGARTSTAITVVH